MKALACSLGDLSKTKTSLYDSREGCWPAIFWLLGRTGRLSGASQKTWSSQLQPWKKNEAQQKTQQNPQNKQTTLCSALNICKLSVSTSGISFWRQSFCLHGFCEGQGAQTGGKVMLRQSCSKSSILREPCLSGRPCLIGDWLRKLVYEFLL